MIGSTDPQRDYRPLLDWISTRSPGEAAYFGQPPWTLAKFREMQAVKDRMLRQENQQKVAEAPTMRDPTPPAQRSITEHGLLNHAANVRAAFKTHYIDTLSNARSVAEAMKSAIEAIAEHCAYDEQVLRLLVDKYNENEQSRDKEIADLRQRIEALEKAND